MLPTFFESVPYFKSCKVTPKPLQKSTPTPLLEVPYAIILHQSKEPEPLVTLTIEPISLPHQTYQHRNPLFVVHNPEVVQVPKVIANSSMTPSDFLSKRYMSNMKSFYTLY